MIKKVVVTGASGHIGFNVAKLLIDKGYETHLLIRKENINIFKLKQHGAVVHSCDLLNSETYKNILSDTHSVFHLAAENTTKKDDEARILENTSGIAETFINECVKQKVKTIIYTSSVVVLGRSENKNELITENDKTKFVESPYVAGKLKAEEFVEKLIKENDVDIRRLYPAWVIGSGDSRMTPPHQIISNFVSKGQPFYFQGGISLSDVESVAEAQVNALEKGKKNEKYVLGGENVTFKQFYDLLAKYSGHKKPFVNIPKWLIVAGATFTKPIFKMFGMEPIIEPAYAKSVFGNFSWYDSSKAQNEIDYKITKADDLLKNAVTEARKRISATLNLGIQKNPFKENSSEKGKLLITGAPGWLGNRMIDVLINGDKDGEFQSNRKVKLLVQPQYQGFLNLPKNFEIVYGDITDKNSLAKVLENVSTVFHIAGAIYPPKIKTLYEVNFKGTK
ncbi:MAG: NAD-dependent epimerase/dehydratase family protein, partial [Bacteroidota bacterium]|nr:NAD-dependent epimerase/dehydratase family protein [Bacteroidota bacterium]